MKLILLSGGSGKRLWPLSNEARSKQFLRILDSTFGEKESMVQRVWGQINAMGFSNDTCIATSKSQIEILRTQLGSDLKLIVEPERRDTFPAIALAATYLYSIEGVSLDETIAVLPVDPYVENEFFETIRNLDNVLNSTKADLALVGAKPSYPSEKYGYIVPATKDNNINDYDTVLEFVEKPHKLKAQSMIKENALWNCGVFSFKLNYIINLLIDMELPIQYDEMLKRYSTLPSISFDYKVVEKATNIVVTPYNGYWKDLGTWNTLTDEMANHIVGRGYVSEDSSNSHIINELNIPVKILGLSNIVVATSADGILVSDKEASPRIKEILKDDSSRPMYEERRWGNYQVLDHTKNKNGDQVLTKRICIKAGNNLSYQYHNQREEMWTIVSGEGELIIDGKFKSVKQGELVRIPYKTLHTIKAITDLEIIEVQLGSELIEEDIVRVNIEWSDIIESCV